MANQFGENVDNEVAYTQARGALKFIPTEDLPGMQALVNGPVQQKALDDEIAARAEAEATN